MQPERDTAPEVRTGFARSGDQDIAYEDMGNPDDPAVLLIMGLGAQLTLWHNEFCEMLVGRGYRVIRFDNRDVGLSTKVHGQRAKGPLIPRLLRSFVGLPSPSVYRLEDMAGDAAAVLDHLGIKRAHIVGASMGGMIAQIFAARYPERTGGLGIIFSSNNSALLPPPEPGPSCAHVTKSKACTMLGCWKLIMSACMHACARVGWFGEGGGVGQGELMKQWC